jgi:hypothetical protein
MDPRAVLDSSGNFTPVGFEPQNFQRVVSLYSTDHLVYSIVTTLFRPPQSIR